MRCGIGVRMSHFLDIHPTLGGDHEGDGLGRPVDQATYIRLCVDLLGGRDQDLLDLEALDVHSQDRLRVGPGFPGRARQLDPACLSPPSGMDLGFHHDPPRQLLSNVLCLLRGLGDLPRGDGNAGPSEDLLRLIFVDIHLDPRSGLKRVEPRAIHHEGAGCSRALGIRGR